MLTPSPRCVPSLHQKEPSNFAGQHTLRQPQAAAAAIISLESEANSLDKAVGDGDTGTTTSQGARAVLDDLEKGK